MIEIKLSQINSSIVKPMYVGKISFSVLEKLARLTARRESGGGDDKFFQREVDRFKVNKIVAFIERAIYNDYPANLILKDGGSVLSLFPTAMILSFDIDFADTEDAVEVGGELIKIDNDKLDNQKPIFIVDGQHRFQGVKVFYEKHPDLRVNLDIEFPVTVLVGYDIFEQSRIFANVNFEQKPVNKSLYYDIFGSLPEEKNVITLAHYTAKHLNEDEDSPIKGMVKMLGSGPGIVSQAFLVESIMNLIGRKGVFEDYYIDYLNKGYQFNKILIILKDYFRSLQRAFPEYWPKENLDGGYITAEYKSILMKTTGIGALMKFLNYIKAEVKQGKSFDDIFSLIKLVKSAKGGNLFGDSSQFSKAGGGGLQSSLFKEIKYRYDYGKFITKKYQINEIIDAKRIRLNGNIVNEISFTNGNGNRLRDIEISEDEFSGDHTGRVFDV